MEKVIGVARVAGVGVLVAVATVRLHRWWLRRSRKPSFKDFDELRAHLASKQDRKDEVKVQGTILKEQDRILKSENGEMEGVARRVWSKTPDEELRKNISVTFLLGDPNDNTIRVLDVHTAKGVDSVMQLVSSDQQYRESILPIDARVWLSGCARIEGDTTLMNPKEIGSEKL